MTLRSLFRSGTWLAIALILPALSTAAIPLHLLGFVVRMCPGEPHCFDLRVEPEFIALVGDRIRIRFANVKKIYDPENYELSLAQQNIVPGSHLRMLIEKDDNGEAGEYRASHIWIGD